MSENKRNLTEKEEYYKLITDEKSNHIGTNANGAGSQCVRRKNIGSLSFRERYLSLRKEFNEKSLDSFSFYLDSEATVSLMLRVATSLRMASSSEMPVGLIHSTWAKPA